MTKAKAEKGRYIATVGINYPLSSSGIEMRVEEGDTVEDMMPTSLKHELEAGNVIDTHVKPEEKTDEEGSDG